EDGIRDGHVTGVQTCALPIWHPKDGKLQYYCGALLFRRDYASVDKTHADEILRRLHTAANLLAKDAASHCQLGKVYRWVERWQRSEERRVGKECRARCGGSSE